MFAKHQVVRRRRSISAWVSQTQASATLGPRAPRRSVRCVRVRGVARRCTMLMCGVEAAVITRTLDAKPRDPTHWTTRATAKQTGLSQSTISRIWRAFGLQPQRQDTLKPSSDPICGVDARHCRAVSGPTGEGPPMRSLPASSGFACDSLNDETRSILAQVIQSWPDSIKTQNLDFSL